MYPHPPHPSPPPAAPDAIDDTYFDWSCHHHVDKDTKYLSNRLKELKHERFSRVFGGSEQLSRAGLEAGAREQAVTAENNLGGAMLQGMGWRGGGLGRDEGGTTEAPRGRGARHFGQ